MRLKKTKIVAAISGILILGIIAYIAYSLINPSNPQLLITEQDPLAKCLTENSAILYGASWCPHCKEQKEMFGEAEQYLPYLECANSDGSQVKACVDAGIRAYPTWIFADGTKKEGKLSLAELAELAGCYQ
jgi:thiol-disulfide isomerase/thioredoxin